MATPPSTGPPFLTTPHCPTPTTATQLPPYPQATQPSSTSTNTSTRNTTLPISRCDYVVVLNSCKGPHLRLLSPPIKPHKCTYCAACSGARYHAMCHTSEPPPGTSATCLHPHCHTDYALATTLHACDWQPTIHHVFLFPAYKLAGRPTPTLPQFRLPNQRA